MRESSEFKYVGETWPFATLSGWNHESIHIAQVQKHPAFKKLIEAPNPLGIAHEANPPVGNSLVGHNLIMAFAYVLGRTLAWSNHGVMWWLDWGCGLGHYSAIAKELYPEGEIYYTGVDLPKPLDRVGILDSATNLYDGLFQSSNAELQRRFNLVMASGSINYVAPWKALMARLTAKVDHFLYITRLPTVLEAPSFVFSQNARKYGYDTDLIGWCLNKGEFLDYAKEIGLHLEREFMVEENPIIDGALEQPVGRGFLFTVR